MIMGYDFRCEIMTKAEFVKAELATWTVQPTKVVVKAEEVWCVADGQVVLGLLLKSTEGWWGVKWIHEECHPYHYSCPAAILKAAGAPKTEEARAWRAKVEAHVGKVEVGEVVEHENGQHYRVVEVKGRVLVVQTCDLPLKTYKASRCKFNKLT
jgi:hypothetical protein